MLVVERRHQHPLHIFTELKNSPVDCGDVGYVDDLMTSVFSPFSGVYFQGTTIGMAPIMSMCTAEQSGGIVMVRKLTACVCYRTRARSHTFNSSLRSMKTIFGELLKKEARFI